MGSWARIARPMILLREIAGGCVGLVDRARSGFWKRRRRRFLTRSQQICASHGPCVAAWGLVHWVFLREIAIIVGDGNGRSGPSMVGQSDARSAA